MVGTNVGKRRFREWNSEVQEAASRSKAQVAGGGHGYVALAAYLWASLLFFGVPVLTRLSRSYVAFSGDRGDPNAFAWFLAWWPHAITHGVNPFTPQAVWAPTGINLGRAGADSMLWQAQSDMYFRLAGGYVSCEVPPAFKRWPIVPGLLYGALPPDYGEELKSFLGAHRVGTIIVSPESHAPSRLLLSTLGTRPVAAGGLILYRVLSQVLTRYRNATPSPEEAVVSNCP